MAKTNKPRVRVAGTASKEEEVSAPKYKVEAKAMVQQTNVLIPRKFQKVPTVWYSPIAWEKIQRAVTKCPQEVGWMGVVEELENGDFHIDDIYIPKQTVHGAETDILPEDLAELACSLEDPSRLCYWGHSHVNMGVGPSGQDEEQTSEYLEHTDFFIRGIYNKKGDSKVDVFDMRKEIVYQKVPNKMLFNPMSEEEFASFDEVLEENVKKYVAPASRTSVQNKSNGTTSNSSISSSATLTRKEQKALKALASRDRRKNPFILRGKGGSKH